MTDESKPSVEVNVVDVPDVVDFDAKFVYQYFVAGEAVDADSGTSQRLLSKPGEFFDTRVVDYLGSARAPRYVVLTWRPVSVRDRVYGQSIFAQDAPPPSGYLKSNLNKVLSEDHFASERYTSVTITDQSIDRKMFSEISSSAVLLNSQRQLAASQRGLALSTNAVTTDQVDFQFLSKYLVQPSEDGVFFFEENGQRIRNDAVNRLKNFSVDVQLNNSVVHSLVRSAASFPESTFSSAYLSMFDVARKLEGRAKARGLKELRADDYRTIVPSHVSLTRFGSAEPNLATRARMIGYIVDRYEAKTNGNVVKLEPIVVENPAAGSTVDFGVKYYAKYQYDIRSVVELTMPAVVEDTGELVVTKFLVASRPSTPKLVECVDLTPPPPPADTRFTWDWDADKLVVSWSFPPHPQRDVKQFQVFRRSSVSEPFQLLRQYVFDDSEVAGPYHETPDPRLIEASTNPKMRFVDDEFKRTSDYIYALGSVDAHGIVSTYGPQSRVTFDRDANRLRVERISPAGAPRPYPNVHLKAKPFLDSVVESRKTKMTIAFQPEHLRVVDSAGNDLHFLQTDKTGGSYKILAINTDLAVSGEVEIVVEDRRSTKERLETARSAEIPDYGDTIAKFGIRAASVGHGSALNALKS